MTSGLVVRRATILIRPEDVLKTAVSYSVRWVEFRVAYYLFTKSNVGVFRMKLPLMHLNLCKGQYKILRLQRPYLFVTEFFKCSSPILIVK